MTRVIGPSRVFYETNDPPEVHNRLWDEFSGYLAFDIGANYGQSLRAMVTAGRFRKAVACEPSYEAFAVASSEFGSDRRVTLLQTAVGDIFGVVELSVCEGAIAGGELLPPDMVGNSPDSWWSGEIARRSVPCTTLDLLAADHGMPDMVKVDTEGSEVRVLRGAGALLGHTEWLVEWHSPALREQCKEILAGYRLEEISYPYPGGRPPYEGEPQNGWLKATLRLWTRRCGQFSFPR